MTNPIRNGLLAALFMVAGLCFHPVSAQATLLNDLNTLVTESQDLDTQLKAITLTANTVCGPLVAANQTARNLVNTITQIDQGLSAPLQVDADVLAALEQLAITSASLANESLRLSVSLQTLSQTAPAFTIKDGIVAMLQLSDDIGAMADRIGEMSDKILVMSDNIGLMADRIITTQQIQSQNLQLTQQTMLQTQTNMLTVASLVQTSTNDLTLAQLIADGNQLAARMTSMMLNPFTIKSQLASMATDVHTFLAKVTTAYGTIGQQTATSTLYIDATSLTSLANLSIMLTSLATAVDGYVIAIDGMKNMISNPNLSASLKSMLQLSADIGVMANRILEMGDVILAMADNIGMEADQIIITQQLQSANVATVQTSILASQSLAITIIAARNL